MADVTLYHNPNCSTSRKALDILRGLEVDFEVVQYLKTPPDRRTLESIVRKLEDPAADLVRHDSHFKELGLDQADYETPRQVVDLLLEHPRLMQRPVLVRDGHAIIGRPLERVAPFVK